MTLTPNGDGVLRLEGELGFHSSEKVWDRLIAEKREKLVLDLSGLTRIDSAGVATLVAFVKHSRERQMEVTLSGAPAQLLTMARVSGVDTMLPLAW